MPTSKLARRGLFVAKRRHDIDRHPAILTDGPLRYYAAENTVVFVQTPIARLKVCRIVFGRSDGSIYVDFPYHVAKEGLLSEVFLPLRREKPITLDLSEHGTYVTTDVKFAHHTSGEAHFSKTGKATALPARQSFPLPSSMGAIFEASIFWLHALTELDQIKGRDAHIGFRFEEPSIQSVVVRAEWRRKSDISANREVPLRVLGPETTGVHRSSGAVTFFRMLGQPRGFPLQDHLLLVTASPIEMVNPEQEPSIAFFGGWNEHEQTPENPDRQRHTCLAFMYPARRRGPRSGED